MADLLNTPSVNTSSQAQKKEVPYSVQNGVKNWARQAAGEPTVDLSIPKEDQDMYDFMDKYYPNYGEESAKAAYGYGDFLNNKTSNYSQRMGDFHNAHKNTLRNELKRLHPDWDDKMLNEKSDSLYTSWGTSKMYDSTPSKMKEYAVKDNERSQKQMHDDVQSARKSLMNAKSYGTPEDHAKWSKEYYDQERADVLGRKNALQNIQNTVKNTGKSEMDSFTDSLNDYMDKNPKGRDDIPVTTRR